MDMEATVSSTIFKKKTFKSTFYGPAGGSFSQKKKVVLDNVKYSGNKRNISLSKSGSGDSVYSDVESLSGKDEDVSMSGANGESLLGLAATTPKAKRVNTGASFGSPLGSPNFHMDDDKVVLSFHLSISLEKKATILSKFEGIIQSTFTSEKNMEMAASLAREKKIDVNSDLKKQKIHLDWAVVVKKISMDTPKEMIVTALAEFGEIKSIKIQLIGLWQKAVVEFAELGQAEQLAAKWSFLI
ncbi:hypothetical protein G9A89_001358 [Geosiphon pyriformis]|nr:hypothetical protein G9A89_001358 [Geosiphon pyriformis]